MSSNSSKGDFSLLKRVKTSYGAHLVSYSMTTGVRNRGVKLATHLNFGVEIKNERIFTSVSSTCFYGMG